ncbi:Hypothetical protein D9617_24g017050 [Elsinoe fawcettii]|nr:Hypothetical protein D9617_24g017050 [Elsinoe fawcettii]
MAGQKLLVSVLAAVAQGAIVRRFTVSDTPQGTVDPGIISDCTYWAYIQTGDTCQNIQDYFGLTRTQFVGYNPALKDDCSGLTVGHAYCAEQNYGNGPSPSTTSPTNGPTSAAPSSTLTTTTSRSITTTTSPTGPTAPSPTQPGLISTCKTYYLVQPGDYCQKIVDQYGTFSLSDFYTWNPAIGSTCSGLQSGYYVCVGLSSTPTMKPTTAAPSPTPTNDFPSPVQSGITSGCKNFYLVQPGDFCQKIVDQYGTFTINQFYTWNPAVGTNCASLQSGYYVCVGISGTPTSRPPTTSPSPTSNPIPSPVQPGIIKTCTKYDRSDPGGSCSVFGPRVGISLAQLYAWNPVLGYHGEKCSTNFLANTYYCTSVSGPLPAPGPTQAGIVDTCTGYTMANPGGTCPVFSNRVGITLQQLYAWNPVLGSNGQNCQTQFWGNEYYCTSVAG